MMYCIVGNFRGRKLSQIGEKYNFHGETFTDFSHAVPKNATTLNFAEKTFANSYKFAIVFSLKSFPLYSNHTEHVHVCLMVHDKPVTTVYGTLKVY